MNLAVLFSSVSIFLFILSADTHAAVIPVEGELQNANLKSAFHKLKTTLLSFREKPTKDLTCLECRSAVGAIDAIAEAGASDDEIMALAIEVCNDFNMYPSDVCEEMVYVSAPEVIYIIKSTGQSYETLCGWLLVGDHCNSHDLTPWEITIPPNKPPPSHPVPDPSSRTLKILHISDLHVDHLYEQDTLVECDHPICCRIATNSTPPEGKELSGYWGSYGKCDIPMRTVHNGIEEGASHYPDLVYLTGDLPPHDVWMQSHDTILSSIESIIFQLKKTFDVPIYLALGNHESAPVNSFVVPSEYEPSGWNMDWLYTNLADNLDSWLPDTANPTIKKGAYFVANPFPGFKVISVNMNYGHNGNWWLLMNNIDPAEELQWLISELLIAEEEGDKVHILGHVPPSGCENSWSHAFNRIVARFESTITGLFFGHTHSDQWEVHFDPDDDTRPVAMSYIAPSMTIYGDANPSFRIYQVDGGYSGATYVIMDTETYRTNITIANEQMSSPVYELNYKASEAYNMTGFTPEHWANITWDMATDDELFNKYLSARYTRYADPPQIGNCDSDCRKSHLCGLYKSDRSNHGPCQRIQDQVDNPATK